MFKKYAKVEILASGNDEWKVLDSVSKIASHYTEDNRLNIKGILEEVADEYKVSRDPKDYYFVAVRANSVNIPNENGDAFAKSELRRFDHHLAKRVYQTYIAKPLHVNHKADNPKMARGVIFDAHYNSANDLSDDKKRAVKKAYGIDLQADEFVEVLVGIDKTKDNHLAEGIKKGVLDSFSMGCECEKTRCSICDHIAHTRLEFCDHIRNGKMKTFAVSNGKKVAFEWCEGVVFGELSAVDQPADPTALTQEVLDIQGRIASLESGPEVIENQSQILLLQARLRKLEEAIQSMGDTMPSKNKKSQALPAAIPTPPSVPEQISAQEEEEEKEFLDKVAPAEEEDILEEESEEEDLELEGQEEDDIGEFREEMEEEEEEEGPLTPDEVGIKEEASKKPRYKFAKAYSNIRAKTTKKGNILVVHPEKGPIFTILGSRVKTTLKDVLKSIAAVGLHATAKKFKALVKDAQGGVTDFAESTIQKEDDPRVLDQSLDDRGDSNMQEKPGEEGVESATSEGEVNDKQEDPEVRVGQWEELPKGWGKGSLESFWKSIGGSVTECMKEVEGHVSDPGAFCASLKDKMKGTTEWREGPKKGQEEDMLMEGQEGEGLEEEVMAELEEEKEGKCKMSSKVAQKEQLDSIKRSLEDLKRGTLGKKVDPSFKVTLSQSFDKLLKSFDELGSVLDYAKMQNMIASKQAQEEKSIEPEDGALDGRETNLEEEESMKDEESLSVLDNADSNAQEKQAPKEVDEDVQEGAVMDHEEKLEARLKTLYKNRYNKAIDEFKRDFAARFIRAAKLATKREACNLEQSLIKQAMGDTLMSPLQIGKDDEIPPTDAQATIALVERAITPKLMNAYVENLFSKSAKLMKMSDDALMQIESDLDNLNVIEPPIANETIEKESMFSKSSALKKQASEGNLIFAPSPVSETVGQGKRENIKEALKGTVVSRFNGKR